MQFTHNMSHRGAQYDTELYGEDNKSQYTDTINDDSDNEDDNKHIDVNRLRAEILDHDTNDTSIQQISANRKRLVSDKDNAYTIKRLNRMQQLSPTRADPYSEKQIADNKSTYIDAMRDTQLQRDKYELQQLLQKREQERSTDTDMKQSEEQKSWSDDDAPVENDNDNNWAKTPSLHDNDNNNDKASKRSRWDSTPDTHNESKQQKSSRWDQTPAITTNNNTAKQVDSSATPLHSSQQSTQQTIQYDTLSAQQHHTYTVAELDAILPSEGYEICQPPADYIPIQTPARKLMSTPLVQAHVGYSMPDRQTFTDIELPQLSEHSGLPGFVRPDDSKYFVKLLQDVDERTLSKSELIERRIMTLLLKIKNGTAPQRKTALRQLSDNARTFGAGPLLDQILPLLMSSTLEDQERHLLVKCIDRILYKLDDLIRPYVHKILVVMEPLLIDEDYYARIEGREIISNLSKAAGLSTMIATMRFDIDHSDEYVRNTTARAFAVVAGALGINQLLPFLKAVCSSKKSWQARHTGIKIVQQIGLLLGSTCLPYLTELVQCIQHGLQDEQSRVRCITGLALSALAEAASPYGIESFDTVLRSLWKGIRIHRGKTLAAFIKAIGYIIPLMEAQYAAYYTREVMPVVCREYNAPDEEMKKIVLNVTKQCVQTYGVDAAYIKSDILPNYFPAFWTRRSALDKRMSAAVIECTVALGEKCGTAEILNKLVPDLKDDSEPYRRMLCDCIYQLVKKYGILDVDEQLEQQLMDGLLYTFQEQTSDDVYSTKLIIDCFATVISTLGLRAKLYLPQISGVLKWRLNNKVARIRGQSADLIKQIAPTMYQCNELQLLNHLSVVLYEYLGEEYPDVLGSIIGALSSIVTVVGCTQIQPSISNLLPRLTPILRNRHERVQENTIELIGRIADTGAEYVSAKEWLRICIELIDLLKAHRKSIRRATVQTFGYIAKAIGPTDVLHQLLQSLKLQDRQLRVCITVAIAIVAESCLPFTVLPALMNEYRVAELNVQNGVLKSLSFLFEYIGAGGRDYVYSVLSLIEDAMCDRDQVHRQIGANIIKHMSLGCSNLDREDAVLHCLNYVWPNIFETSPHVINSMIDAIDACRVAVGPIVLLLYIIQGLYHPARRVRTVYWKLYNMIHYSSVDTLVSAYPQIQDQASTNNVYQRHELEMFI